MHGRAAVAPRFRRLIGSQAQRCAGPASHGDGGRSALLKGLWRCIVATSLREQRRERNPPLELRCFYRILVPVLRPARRWLLVLLRKHSDSSPTNQPLDNGAWGRSD